MRKISELLKIGTMHHRAFGDDNKENQASFMCHAMDKAHKEGEIDVSELNFIKQYIMEEIVRQFESSGESALVTAVALNIINNNKDACLCSMENLVGTYTKEIWECIIWKLEEAGQ